jgi:hypothetical protein
MSIASSLFSVISELIKLGTANNFLMLSTANLIPLGEILGFQDGEYEYEGELP